MEETSCRAESELPNKMAHLDIMEVDETGDYDEQETFAKPSRVLRKRKSLAPEVSKPSNRRVSMKPRKHVMADSASTKQIEALYLNKKVKNLSQTLETIYEEPKTDSSNNEGFIGGRKVKRLLIFHTGTDCTKEKIKKRRAKIKKLLGNKSFLNRKKIPMNVFLQTIDCLDLEETAKTEVLVPNKLVT